MKVSFQYRVHILLLSSILIKNVNCVKYPKSFNAYPPLYDFDDYDACLNGKDSKFESTYCMIYAEIKPQNSSTLWQQISQHNEEYKFHFRRDRLFFGVCMERCKNYPKITQNKDSRVRNERSDFFEMVHKRPLDLQMRSEYHELINNCLNSEFQNKYELNLKTYVEYCERSEKQVEKDSAEKIVYKILEIIIILNILSTLYDSCLKRKQPIELQNSDYYKINPQQPVSNLLTAFSIRRNYYRLTEPPTTQLGVDLNYLDGIRSICVFIVTIGHAYFIQYYQVKNPEVFEEFAKSSKHLWLTNGTLLLENFHVLSGMLLYIKFKELFKISIHSSGRDCFKVFFKGMLMRFFRFFPSLALFIGVNATFFTRLQEGPFWRHLTEPGRTFAREKWWKKFFIFDKISESGFPHTWYMITDWQLFAFYFGVIIIIEKYPQYKRKILTSIALLAILIPTIICYINKMEPCFLITPETFRFSAVHEDEVAFYKLYTPFYTNLGGYLCGIICGEIYLNFYNNETFCKQISLIPQKLLEFSLWFSILFGAFMSWLGTAFIFQEPSMWTALHAGLNRNIYVVMTACVPLLLTMFCKSLSLSDFLKSSGCRIFARLSYQIYLWQFSVLYLLVGYIREPIYTNHLYYSSLAISLLVLSIVLSFIITVFVEYPILRVINFYVKKKNHRSKELLLVVRTEYIYDFPPLYKFDDYDACLAQNQYDNEPTYAVVYAEIKPNNSSELWHQMMQHFQEYPHRYRYDRLFFGVCIQRCKNYRNLRENYKLEEEDLIKNEITNYFAKVHKRPLDVECRRKYHELIHNCLDHEFEEKYYLNLKTFIEYCEASKQVEKKVIDRDPLESLLYKIIGIIIILNILSSLYDFCLKLQQPEENQSNDFYKINPHQTVSRLLTSFSVCRNYYRLIQPYFGDVGNDFKFLDGFRSVCMMLALFGHTFFMEYQHIANPQYFEKSPKDENKLWYLNTTVIIETYFVMSGLLLFVKFQQGRFVTPQTSWKKFCITYIKLMLKFYALSRFLPSVALLVLFNATVLTNLQDGPFWRHITEPVRVFSREKGWRHLLMINNVNNKESASHHTWYIAADWQLFALYLLIIMIVSKYPKYKKYIYSSLAILSFAIPFSIAYWQKLQPCFIIKPEYYRYTFFKDIKAYFEIYVPFYTNLFGYLFGIICGEIYLKYTRTETVRKFIHEHPMYIAAVHLNAIVAFLIFWLGPIMDAKEPSIWTALYAGLHRNLWIIFVCGIPLIFMSCNCGWIAYEFCCLPIFRVLARLSFQVYIWHMTIIYMANGYQRQPYYVNNFYFFSQFITVYFVSTGMAFLIALFFEYPIAQSIQVLQSKRNDKVIKKS
ncbi:uncharacterized protein ACRADG_011146 [Cochliomyia hominivorax]